MHIKIFRMFFLLLLIVWMLIIFNFSSQTATQSSKTSGGVIEKIITTFNEGFSNLSQEEQQNVVEKYQFIIRKTAHFSVYGVLGVLSFLTMITYTKLGFYIRSYISAGVCLLYAASDEFHQLFVIGRGAQVRDVCIDFLGSVTGIVIATLFTRYIKAIYNKVKKV